AVLFTHVFSGRGAFVHVGALVGTIMAANVFMVIIPNQKRMTAQLLRGEAPDPKLGAIGKQRSLHNNYLTRPGPLMWVSQHSPSLSSHPQSWLIVALILVRGGVVRHALNRADAGDRWQGFAWTLPVAALALVVTIYATAPRAAVTVAGGVADAEAPAISHKHCVMCHAQKPTHPSFAEAAQNRTLETIEDMRRYAPLIVTQAVVNRAMPLGNQTAMTDEERARLGQWARGFK